MFTQLNHPHFPLTQYVFQLNLLFEIVLFPECDRIGQRLLLMLISVFVHNLLAEDNFLLQSRILHLFIY